MFYDEYVFWCKSKGMTPNKVAVLNGLSEATPTSWKKRRLTPRFEIQKKLADFFEITIEELNDHTLHQELGLFNFDNPNEKAKCEKINKIKSMCQELNKEQLDGIIKIISATIDLAKIE